MPRLRLVAIAACVGTFGLGACGGGDPEPDNAAIDQTLNQLIANDEAERRQLVEAARAREEVREKEMEQRSPTDGEAPD